MGSLIHGHRGAAPGPPEDRSLVRLQRPSTLHDFDPHASLQKRYSRNGSAEENGTDRGVTSGRDGVLAVRFSPFRASTNAGDTGGRSHGWGVWPRCSRKGNHGVRKKALHAKYQTIGRLEMEFEPVLIPQGIGGWLSGEQKIGKIRGGLPDATAAPSPGGIKRHRMSIRMRWPEHEVPPGGRRNKAARQTSVNANNRYPSNLLPSTFGSRRGGAGAPSILPRHLRIVQRAGRPCRRWRAFRGVFHHA